ncbi:MAG: hypothetical protein LBJ08_12340, partial [Bifidobacteriaceae bacterium]|nr:hypothetical protein [Bifidobacteriaceae bacterium]
MTMTDSWADPERAQRGVADPSTTPADLATIAHLHPELRTSVAWHAGAYPALLEWLARYGGPGVAAAVVSRQNADQAVLTQSFSSSDSGAAAAGAADGGTGDTAAGWRSSVIARPGASGPRPPGEDTLNDPERTADVASAPIGKDPRRYAGLVAGPGRADTPAVPSPNWVPSSAQGVPEGAQGQAPTWDQSPRGPSEGTDPGLGIQTRPRPPSDYATPNAPLPAASLGA